MIDLLYEKQGSYLQGQEDRAIEIAKRMLIRNYPIEDITAVKKITKSKILKRQAKLAREETAK